MFLKYKFSPLLLIIIIGLFGNKLNGQNNFLKLDNYKKYLYKSSVTLNFGPTFYYGDIKNIGVIPAKKNYEKSRFNYGFGFNSQINAKSNVKLNFVFGSLSSSKNYAYSIDTITGLKIYPDGKVFNNKFYNIVLLGTYNISEYLKLNPYLQLNVYGIYGLGVFNYRTKITSLENNKIVNYSGYIDGIKKANRKTALILPLGVGAEYKIKDGVFVNAELSLNNILSDKVDLVKETTMYDKYWTLNIGAKYNLSGLFETFKPSNKSKTNNKNANYNQIIYPVNSNESLSTAENTDNGVVIKQKVSNVEDNKFTLEIKIDKKDKIDYSVLHLYFPNEFNVSVINSNDGFIQKENGYLKILWNKEINNKTNIKLDFECSNCSKNTYYFKGLYTYIIDNNTFEYEYGKVALNYNNALAVLSVDNKLDDLIASSETPAEVKEPVETKEPIVDASEPVIDNNNLAENKTEVKEPVETKEPIVDASEPVIDNNNLAENKTEVKEPVEIKEPIVDASEPVIDNNNLAENKTEVKEPVETKEPIVDSSEPVIDNNNLTENKTEVKEPVETKEPIVDSSDPVIDNNNLAENKTEVKEPVEIKEPNNITEPIFDDNSNTNVSQNINNVISNSNVGNGKNTDDNIKYRVVVAASEYRSNILSLKRNFNIQENIVEQYDGEWYKYIVSNFNSYKDAMQYCINKQILGSRVEAYTDKNDNITLKTPEEDKKKTTQIPVSEDFSEVKPTSNNTKEQEDLAKQKLAEEARLQEIAKQKQEAEQLRLKQEEDLAKQKLSEEARLQEIEKQKQEAEQLRLKQAEDLAKQKLAEEARLQEIAKQKQEAEQLKLKQEEEIAKQKLAEEARQQEIAKQKQEAEQLKLKQEEEEKQKQTEEIRLQEINKKYSLILEKADQLFEQKQLNQSKEQYKLSLEIKPNEQYPQSRIDAIEILLKENLIKSESLINKGDSLFNLQQYYLSREKYTEANDIYKKDETTAKIENVNNIIRDIENKKLEYQEVIKKADIEFNGKNYVKALELYELVLKTDSENNYLKNRKEETEAIILKAKQVDEINASFNNKIKVADEKYNSNLLEEAISLYEEALLIKPNDIYVAEKIKNIKYTIDENNKIKINYTKLIFEADSLVKKDELKLALNKYYKAKELKIEEVEINNKIDELKLQIQTRENDLRKFNKLNKEADSLYIIQSFEQAILKYEELLKLKQDTAIENKIKDINSTLNERNTKTENYKNAINKADELFNNKSYDDAINYYNKALEYNKEEAYPRNQINIIKDIIESENKTENDYKKAVKLGDSLFNSNQYNIAIEQYKLAKNIKPEESSIIDEKINAINNKILEIENAEKYYDNLLQNANKNFDLKNYAESKTMFEEAYILRQDVNVKNKINELKIIIDKEEQSRILFESTINSAEKSLGEKSYKQALLEYTKALDIRPENKEISDKIIKLNSIIDSISSINEDYNLIINIANHAFETNDLEKAKEQYNLALKYKPEEQYPKQQIEKINSIIYENKLKTEEFNKIVNEADNAYNNNLYDKAKTIYKQALELNKYDNYLIKRISQIDSISKSIETKRYNDIIKTADSLENLKEYEQAINKYNQANSLNYDEKVDNKITSIKQIIELNIKNNLLYKGSIKTADSLYKSEEYTKSKVEYVRALELMPNDNYSLSKIEQINSKLSSIETKEKLYSKTIKEADSCLNIENYNLALTYYYKAKDVKEGKDLYSDNKIFEINKKIQEKENIFKNYKKLLNVGDSLLKVNEHNKAKSSYNEALKIYPDEYYPQTKLKEIELYEKEQARRLDNYKNTLYKADSSFNERNYEQAKLYYQKSLEINSENKYVSKQISKSDSLIKQSYKVKEQNKNTIKLADSLFEAGKYNEAKEKYKVSLLMFPNEEYSKKRVEAIDNILERISESNKQYNEYVKNADEAFKIQDYVNANKLYNEAAKYKINDEYCNGKLKEIDNILNYNKQQLNDYKEQVKIADSLFSVEEYVKSKTNYEESLSFKTNTEYSKKMIDSINVIINNLSAEKQKEYDLNLRYDNLLKEANNNFIANKYSEAKASYSKALEIRPNEKFITDKIYEIDSIFRKIDENKKTYTKNIVDADIALELSEYDKAEQLYNSALILIPNEIYPKKKIEQIKDIKLTIATQKGELPLKKEEIDINYIKEVTLANSSFAREQWQESKTHYEKAKGLKPFETFPRERILILDLLIEEQQNAKPVKAKTVFAEDLVKEADEAYNMRKFRLAKRKYEEALLMNPNLNECKDRLVVLNKLMDGLNRDEKKESRDEIYLQLLSSADKAYMYNNFEDAKKLYQNASLIMPEEEYPNKMLAEVNKILLIDNNENDTIIEKTKEPVIVSDLSYESISKILPEEDIILIDEYTKKSLLISGGKSINLNESALNSEMVKYRIIISVSEYKIAISNIKSNYSINDNIIEELTKENLYKYYVGPFETYDKALDYQNKKIIIGAYIEPFENVLELPLIGN